MLKVKIRKKATLPPVKPEQKLGKGKRPIVEANDAQIKEISDTVIEECKRVLNTGIKAYIADADKHLCEATEKSISSALEARIEKAALSFFSDKAEIKSLPIGTPLNEIIQHLSKGWRVINVIGEAFPDKGIWIQRLVRDKKFGDAVPDKPYKKKVALTKPKRKIKLTGK